MESLACSLSPATEIRLCRHCTSPVSERAGSDFCCQGCETVFGLLQSTGLSRYYSILEKTGERARPVAARDTPSAAYRWLDHDDARRDYETPHGLRFYLEGVHCAACVWLVEKLPQLVHGVTSVRLDLGSAVATVTISPEGSYAAAAEGLLRVGYRPHAIRAREAGELSQREDRRLLTQLGVSAAAAGNIMLLAIALYAGADGAFERKFSWISFGLSIPVMFYSALPFYQSTWKALRARQLSIDVPVAIGLQVSFWVSVANLFRGDDRIYFDSVTTLVFLLLSSRYLLRRVQRKALNASSLAHFLMPAEARRQRDDGSFETVALSELRVGDIIEVLPGDLLPADGIVASGAGSVNCALLTGESLPEKVAPGSEVFGGTQNISAPLTIRITSSGSESRVGRIIESMQASLESRAPIVTFSDQVSRGFIAVTLVLVPLVFVGALHGGWHEALQRALALALVTCPCAFALATPLSFASTLAKAARAGILIKGAEVLERLSRVEQAFFDKTGTLTEGRFQVLDWKLHREPAAPTSSIILSLEASSRHPIARALREHFHAEALTHPLMAMEGIEEHSGRGVSGVANGRRYFIGAARSSHATNAEGRAVTAISLFEDDVEIGTALLGDPIRAEAREVMIELRKLGVDPRILSGDSAEAVRMVGEALEITSSKTTSSATPEQKQAALEQAPRSLMIGDGANDAIALASASVGVAVHGGLEASIRASDIYLSRPGLRQIPRLVVIGRETLRTVRRNFAISLGYNAVAATAAILGKINPLLAAILMPVSAFVVILSATAGTKKLRQALEEASS
jgi:heavy metal translocating P-type ATPase